MLMDFLSPRGTQVCLFNLLMEMNDIHTLSLQTVI